MTPEFDVAIVGYGPVGQMLSILLGRRGWKVVAAERWPSPFRLPRAVHFDAEVARLLQGVGLRSDTSPVVEPYDDLYEWRNAAGETLLAVDWRGRGESGWHTANHFSQPELEDALCRLAAGQPTVTVRRGLEVTGIAQEDGQVRLSTLSHTGERGELTARYVVGCDGANSFVRRAAGIEAVDLGFFFDWLIVDVVPHVPMTFTPRAWQLCDPARPTTVTPSGPGRRRWEFMVLPGEDPAELNTLDKAIELLAPWGVDDLNSKIERHTVYRFQARWAERWRSGRVLIAGDAAHQMPPFAGQGMCSGFRDVCNLEWKLDAVLSGAAGEGLLDTYGAERAPHVRDLVEYSMMLGEIICVTDPEQAALRDRRMTAERARSGETVPPPRPRLGPGVLRHGDPRTGRPSVQGTVRLGAAEGLADDVFGRGWRLVAWEGGPRLRAVAEASPVPVTVVPLADLGDGRHAEDVEGVYAAWRASLAATGPAPAAALVRPDDYTHSVLRDADDAAAALREVAAAYAGG
ncbi:2-polyprenyl-6-methoxyphenol hydroxylase-like FAD-dependent oxidoreductase [Thermocatellispora tengchongensis]|uniref:2-polyprenyl-6-methoxyphenol hydroxylase-like FAD-dependent oxidoreductase n=1 Tax=Thermocatellispora tengchongensis TaxID=1073253 RepID=A0A840PJU6_9ACTN|nr:bifunctional 3-(3-hydroxy-phenyl)propionate/3-hydroxycinnamic acid hydroxylase [Thermocatellispora tengchongensis]MBB5137850.1 2-polyprenyl-6-methoxyphenol hydroxylase-like FAD-dependent oxidoreductase [Thermocatellispora tengchongensis]